MLHSQNVLYPVTDFQVRSITVYHTWTAAKQPRVYFKIITLLILIRLLSFPALQHIKALCPILGLRLAVFISEEKKNIFINYLTFSCSFQLVTTSFLDFSMALSSCTQIKDFMLRRSLDSDSTYGKIMW